MRNVMKNKIPNVSIIMSVYNAEDTLREALDSLLSQTYTDYEIIICDDGSTDGTSQILKSYQNSYPDRFIMLSNELNMFLPYSLNRCLTKARGNYIARMDADDISRSDRLEILINYMDNNQQVDMVGTYLQRFEGHNLNDLHTVPLEPNYFTLRKMLPFAHASIVAKKEVFDKLNGYTVSKRTRRSEDRDLYFRFYHAGFSGVNLDIPLYLVREDAQALRRRTIKTRYQSLLTTYYGFKLLGYPKIWYVRPTIDFAFKSMIPYSLFPILRKLKRKKVD